MIVVLLSKQIVKVNEHFKYLRIFHIRYLKTFECFFCLTVVQFGCINLLIKHLIGCWYIWITKVTSSLWEVNLQKRHWASEYTYCGTFILFVLHCTVALNWLSLFPASPWERSAGRNSFSSPGSKVKSVIKEPPASSEYRNLTHARLRSLCRKLKRNSPFQQTG